MFAVVMNLVAHDDGSAVPLPPISAFHARFFFRSFQSGVAVEETPFSQAHAIGASRWWSFGPVRSSA